MDKAADIISEHNLEEHITVQQKNVMYVTDKWVKEQSIHMIYTTATANMLFFWKIYLLACACTKVQAVVMAKGDLHKLKKYNDVDLYFMDSANMKVPNIAQFSKCSIATAADSDVGEQRNLSIIHMAKLRVDNAQLHDIQTMALQASIYGGLKTLRLNHNRFHIRDKLNNLPDEVTRSMDVDVEDLKIHIVPKRVQTMKNRLKADGNESYALTYIRNLLKRKFVGDNTFLDMWPKHVSMSLEHVSDAGKPNNVYTEDDIQYLYDLF